MKKTLLVAIAAALISTSASFAATVSGEFFVQAVNAVNLNRGQSRATFAHAQAAATAGGTGSQFTYTGDLDFGTFDRRDRTTIADWLNTGVNGSVTGLTPAFGDLQLSKPDIAKDTATTTFFIFSLRSPPLLPGDFTIRHDDGVAVFEDGIRLGGFEGPNGVRTTDVSGYNGGFLQFLYVATNGDPSVLKVDHIAPIPLPASAWLMLAGVGGLAAMRRRKRA